MKLKPLWLAFVAGAFWLLMFIGTHLPKKQNGRKEYGLDKVAHFSAFAILAVLLCLAAARWSGRLRWYHLAGVVTALSLYGMFDEITQAFLTTTRKADVQDWIADTCGAAVGAIAAYAFSERFTNGGKNIGSSDRN